jgi:predicted ArsR family transcriptional regulator
MRRMSTGYINPDAMTRQCSALLHALKISPVSTISAREALGIASPAARVHALRRLGVQISTSKETVFDAAGRPHPVAVYRLAEARP